MHGAHHQLTADGYLKFPEIPVAASSGKMCYYSTLIINGFVLLLTLISHRRKNTDFCYVCVLQLRQNIWYSAGNLISLYPTTKDKCTEKCCVVAS